MTLFVLDNSVTMRWFFEGGTHPYADSVLDALSAQGHSAVVPVLWYYEVSSVLARAQNKGSVPAAEVDDFLEDLRALPIRVDGDSEKHVLSDVHRLAITYKLTSDDAAYLELAVRLRLPLATLDQDLIRACRAADVPLIEQAAVPPP